MRRPAEKQPQVVENSFQQLWANKRDNFKQEKEDLVRAMAKELGDLEEAKDGQIRSANREVSQQRASERHHIVRPWWRL